MVKKVPSIRCSRVAAASGRHPRGLTLATRPKIFWSSASPPSAPHGEVPKTSPTLDCAACILTPDVRSRQSQEYHSLELPEVTQGGRLRRQLHRDRQTQPRYVNEDLLPAGQGHPTVSIRSRSSLTINEGLGKTQPFLYLLPTGQPHVVLIDPEVCLTSKRGTLTDKCKKTCVEAAARRRPSSFKQTGRDQGNRRSAPSSCHRVQDL